MLDAYLANLAKSNLLDPHQV